MEINDFDLSIQERADRYAGHPYEEGESPVITHRRKAYFDGIRDQMEIDTRVIHQINEEWQQRFAAQKTELIDKACAWLDEINSISYTSHSLTINTELFRRAMEEIKLKS